MSLITNIETKDGTEPRRCRSIDMSGAAIIPLVLMEYRGEPHGLPATMPDEWSATSG